MKSIIASEISHADDRHEVNLGVALRACVHKYGEKPALSWLEKPSKKQRPKLQELSYQQLWQRVVPLAHALCTVTALGDRVLLLGGNSPEWIIAQLAIFSAGLTLVPPFPIMTAEEVQHQLRHSQAKVAFVENQAQLKKLGSIETSSLELVVVFLPTTATKAVTTLEDFCKPYTAALDLPLRSSAVTLANAALQFYTESDLGIPVPVLHSHGSLLHNIRYMQATEICQPGDRVVEVLYLAHVYPLLVGLMAIMSGATVVIPGPSSDSARRDVRGMLECLRHGQGDIAALVPYFLHSARVEVEKGLLTPLTERLQRLNLDESNREHVGTFVGMLLSSYRQDILSLNDSKQKWQRTFQFLTKLIVTESLWAAVALYRRNLAYNLTNNSNVLEGMSEALINDSLEGWSLIYATIIYLMTGPIRQFIKASVFGSRMSAIISGGSKLKQRNTEFFEALGLRIYEGYGSSQSGIVNVQQRATSLPSRKQIPETVGPPISAEIKQVLDLDSQEILIASPTLFDGYAGYPELTDRDVIIIHGLRFYRSADLGRLLPSGDLRIVGHLDSRFRMYNSLGGEKIFPLVAEKKLLACELIERVCVWGADVPYNVALVFVDWNSLRDQLNQQDNEQLLTLLENPLKDSHGHSLLHPELMTYAQEQCRVFLRNRVNPDLPGPSKIKALVIAPKTVWDCPELLQDDESRSLNYPAVIDYFKSELKAIYGDMMI